MFSFGEMKHLNTTQEWQLYSILNVLSIVHCKLVPAIHVEDLARLPGSELWPNLPSAKADILGVNQ